MKISHRVVAAVAMVKIDKITKITRQKTVHFQMEQAVQTRIEHRIQIQKHNTSRVSQLYYFFFRSQYITLNGAFRFLYFFWTFDILKSNLVTSIVVTFRPNFLNGP